MDASRKSSMIIGGVLIAFGLLFLIFSLIPGAYTGVAWPIIFYIIAAGFALPAFLWPETRRGLAALFIPGSIFLALGLIFTYTVATQDWVAWAYAWLLIISGVGLGLVLASTFGGWDRRVRWTGIWMLSIATGLFGLFATLFGAPILKIIGSLLVMAVGCVLLFRALRH